MMLIRQSRPWLLVAAPLVFSLSACTASPSRNEPEVVDFTGEWVLNEQLSDSPEEVLGAEAGGNVASTAARRIGGSVGVFGISVNDIVRMLPRRAQQDGQPDFHSHVTDARDTLRVEQSARSVEVTYDQAGTAFYVNGRTTHDQLDEIFSDWQENVFVVTREPDDGPVLTETFELGADGGQLIWTVTFEVDNGKEIVITRVYDAAES